MSKSVETTSGIIYIQNKQYEEARKILLKAIAKDPKDGDAQFYIGIAYSELDSVAQAYQHFTIAKELQPKKAHDIANNIQSNYARHYQLGQNAFKQTDVNKAANEFLLATQADPTQSWRALQPRGHVCAPVPCRFDVRSEIARGSRPSSQTRAAE